MKPIKLFSLILLLNLFCKDMSRFAIPDLAGVWKKVERINTSGFSSPDTTNYRSDIREFMVITGNKMIQKYVKGCYFEVWTFDFVQDQMSIYKTISKSPYRKKYTVTFERETLSIKTDDYLQKFELCDSLTEPNWKNINSYADMEVLAPSFCIMAERHVYWTDPINELQLFNFEESARAVVADTLDFVALNKILCDTGSLFSIVPIIPHNEPVDSFYWYFDGIIKSNEMYPAIWYNKKGCIDVELCVKYSTGRRACMLKPSYLRIL